MVPTHPPQKEKKKKNPKMYILTFHYVAEKKTKKERGKTLK
jgi:hypothetical protein